MPLLELWHKPEAALLEHPTLDHFLPIVYNAAVAGPNEKERFPFEGFDGWISMGFVLFEEGIDPPCSGLGADRRCRGADRRE
jgi:hypothetical protein